MTDDDIRALSMAARHLRVSGTSARFHSIFTVDNGPVIQAASWELWSEIPKAKLWQAVALSLDIEPKANAKLVGEGRISEPQLLPIEANFAKEFQRRMTVATAHLGASGPLRPIRLYEGCMTDPAVDVSLPEFAALADSLQWAMPPRFPRHKGADSAAAALGKDLGTRERDTLLTIIAALCGYSSIDPKARGAAAQIVQMTEKLGAAVHADTVREVLKKIPDAVERRMK